MKNKNVCKFPPTDLSNELSISRFVLESNKEVMQKTYSLTTHRIVLIEQGSGIFSFDNISYPFTEGTLLFGFEKENFMLLQGENVQYLYIDFHGMRANDLLRRFGIYPSTRKIDGFHGLIPFWKESLSSATENNVDISAESVFLHTLSRLSVNTTTKNDKLKRILEITEEEFRDPDLSLARIADELGYNQKYLSHFFKETMHVNYSEYLRSLRFKYAVLLFEHGVDSVKNVALLCGFSDPLYFSNAFKKVLGVSPKEYIQKIAKEPKKS